MSTQAKIPATIVTGFLGSATSSPMPVAGASR
jgi:hypothetical protein